LRFDSGSGHASRVKYVSGPKRSSSFHGPASSGAASPTPSPEGCRNLAMQATCSTVGKCRAIATACCLTASGRLSSRASSMRNPPAQRSALVRSCGMVMTHLAKTCAKLACPRFVSRAANPVASLEYASRASPHRFDSRSSLYQGGVTRKPSGRRV